MEIELEASAFGIELELGAEVKLEYTMRGQVHRDFYKVKASTINTNGGCQSTVYRLRLQRREYP